MPANAPGTAVGPYDYDRVQAGEGPGPRPYAYYSDSSDGAQGGFGQYNGPRVDGEPGTEQGNWGSFGAGRWVDPSSGKVNTGVMAEGGIYKTGQELGKGPLGTGWDYGLGTASAGIVANDSTFGIGASANIAEASVTAGDASDNARFGISEGVGAGARVHYGDQDHDGVRELGFGFDLGPASFDMKSEMLGECWNMFNDPEADLPGPFW